MAGEEFGALEERVFRAVEMLRSEREQRAGAEARIAELSETNGSLQERLREREARIGALEDDLRQLESERSEVRGRVERLLHHLNEFTS